MSAVESGAAPRLSVIMVTPDRFAPLRHTLERLRAQSAAARILGQVRGRPTGHRLLPGILPILAMGLVAGAAGEVLGYSLGAGDAAQRRLTFELDRLSHVTVADRQRILSGEGS